MRLIEKWRRSLYKILLRHGVITPKVIMQIDGGVCSQMHQYLIGKIYEDKGYRVAFDFTFYKECGSDMNNLFVRNYDLLKAFPYLKLKAASELEISVYKKKYYNVGNDTYDRVYDFSFLQKTPPLYLGGYYHLPKDVWLPAFRNAFKIDTVVLNVHNRQLCAEISSQSCSVAVHVRRGDLADAEVHTYGKPASFEYFQSAIAYMQKKTTNPFFYFFSDEPDYVSNELIPRLQLENCVVVSINGSDKGYMDLFLIAHCTHQITSKGTLGKYGALLNDNKDKIVALCNDETEYPWKDLFCNAVLL